MYLLQFDGSFRNIAEYGGNLYHAGFMGYGWLISKDGKLVARGMGVFACAEYATAHIAEYIALIEGLDALFDMGVRDRAIEIRGDAKSVIDQMESAACISSAPTLLLHERARKLSLQFEQLSWCWVPRENNRAADSLTRQAIRRMHSSDYYQKFLGKLNTKSSQSGELLSMLDLRVFQPAQ
jgi:ribonuclease HI